MNDPNIAAAEKMVEKISHDRTHCYACDRDMRGKWAGAKFGSTRKLCLRCTRLGFFFKSDGTVAHPTVEPENWPDTYTALVLKQSQATAV